MKTLIFIYACSLACTFGNTFEWDEKSRQREMEQIALWETKLAEVQREPPEMRLKELQLGLRNM